MYCPKKNATVCTPTASGFSGASQSGGMFLPQLLALFILLPANLANNLSCVSFAHKYFLVLDCFACVAFDFKLPFYLYKHSELLSLRRMPEWHVKTRQLWLDEHTMLYGMSSFQWIPESSLCIQYCVPNLGAEQQINIYSSKEALVSTCLIYYYCKEQFSQD